MRVAGGAETRLYLFLVCVLKAFICSRCPHTVTLSLHNASGTHQVAMLGLLWAFINTWKLAYLAGLSHGGCRGHCWETKALIGRFPARSAVCTRMGRHLWLPGGAGPARDEPGGPARSALWQRRQVADKEQRRWVFYSDAAFLKRGVTELWRGG